MDYYAGIDVSLERSGVCVMDGAGGIVREAEVASEPAAVVCFFRELGFPVARIGLEAGPLSQWLFAAMVKAGLAVELLETRHVRAALKAMTIKTDRKDARGIAHLMRLGWFRPVHCKSTGASCCWASCWISNWAFGDCCVGLGRRSGPSARQGSPPASANW